MRWRVDIEDKVTLDGYCPPHRWPHGSLVTDERCHYHRALWRMLHHSPFCYLLRCPRADRSLVEFLMHRGER
jgi:hypothetical protein